MELPVYENRRDDSALGTRNHHFIAPFPASLLNSRRPGITYEYIPRFASARGGRFLPFNGNNDSISGWTGSWEENKGSSLAMQLGFMQMAVAIWGLWYSDYCISIDGPYLGHGLYVHSFLQME